MNCRREKAGLPVDDEQEYLPLSWLSQADYCLRRAALLLNERVWVENVETAKGRAEHERVHTQRVERRGDFVKLYENSVFSDKMQISGKCDCIERCAGVCVRRAFSVLQFYCYIQSTRRAVIRVCRMRAKTAKNAGWRWCARGKIRKSRTSWQCPACDVFGYFKRAGS